MTEESIVQEDFEVEFDDAAKFVGTNSSLFNEEQALKFYGLYKLSTVGKCNTERPGMFQWKRQQMWDSWKDLESKDIKNPKQMYVDYLTEHFPKWKTE